MPIDPVTQARVDQVEAALADIERGMVATATLALQAGLDPGEAINRLEECVDAAFASLRAVFCD